MAVENERKYVLLLESSHDLLDELVEHYHGRDMFIKQTYIDNGTRIRRTEDELENIDFKFCYKREINNQIIEIETDISEADYTKLETCKQSSLSKRRVSWVDGIYHWDVDEFLTDDYDVYFRMAEVEMPEDEMKLPALPDKLKPHMLCIVPQHDIAFTSKKLCDVEYARRTYSSLVKKFKNNQ